MSWLSPLAGSYCTPPSSTSPLYPPKTKYFPWVYPAPGDRRARSRFAAGYQEVAPGYLRTTLLVLPPKRYRYPVLATTAAWSRGAGNVGPTVHVRGASSRRVSSDSMAEVSSA